MTTPTADLLAGSVEALLVAHRRQYGPDPCHYHGTMNNPQDCGPLCPAQTRQAAEAALERWRLESEKK